MIAVPHFDYSGASDEALDAVRAVAEQIVKADSGARDVAVRVLYETNRERAERASRSRARVVRVFGAGESDGQQ